MTLLLAYYSYYQIRFLHRRIWHLKHLVYPIIAEDFVLLSQFGVNCLERFNFNFTDGALESFDLLERFLGLVPVLFRYRRPRRIFVYCTFNLA